MFLRTSFLLFLLGRGSRLRQTAAIAAITGDEGMKVRRGLRNRLGRLIGIQADMHIWWAPELPVMYVCNPKAGCSSIKHSLKTVQADAFTRQGRAFTRHPSPHIGDDCLRSSGLPLGHIRDRYLFSCVRNPFTRALSAYLDKVHSGDHRRFPELAGAQADSFEAFLRAVAACKPAVLDHHFRPQHVNLNYPSVAYDAVFFLENAGPMGSWLERIMPEFRLQRFSPHARDAAQKLASHYDPVTLQLVREIYAQDFEVFGYSGDLEHALLAPGAMISRRQLLATRDAPPPLPANVRTPRDTRTLENTVRWRWLIERRLI